MVGIASLCYWEAVLFHIYFQFNRNPVLKLNVSHEPAAALLVLVRNLTPVLHCIHFQVPALKCIQLLNIFTVNQIRLKFFAQKGKKRVPFEFLNQNVKIAVYIFTQEFTIFFLN